MTSPGNRRLPPAVQLHVSEYIQATDLDGIAAQVGNPCRGCPAEHDIEQAGLDDVPVCYSCPLWSLRCDLAQLRLLRRLECGDLGK